MAMGWQWGGSWMGWGGVVMGWDGMGRPGSRSGGGAQESGFSPIWYLSECNWAAAQRAA
jgi:hypothetical protein